MPENTTIEPSVSLDEIVNGYIDQHGLSQSQYRRLYGIAIRGFRVFERDSLGIPITTPLEVLGNNTAVLPVGALNKISVGVLNQRGEITSLTYDPLLSTYDSTSPDRLDQPVDHTLVDNTDLLFSLQDNINIGYPDGGYGQFGQGSTGTIGFYNIDWKNRVMIFNFKHFCPTQVMFTYLGIPCEDGDYYIHPFFQEALIAYIWWQDKKKLNGGKTAFAEMNAAERDFNIQYRNARFAMTPFDPSDVINQYRQGVRLSPKA